MMFSIMTLSMVLALICLGHSSHSINEDVTNQAQTSFTEDDELEQAEDIQKELSREQGVSRQQEVGQVTARLQGIEYSAHDDRISLSPEVFDLLMGRYSKFRSNRNNGVIYTIWGRMSCPQTQGTTMLYTGRAGGTHFSHSGGGANYLCLPETPEYTSANLLAQGNLISYLYGAEYQNTRVGDHDDNVPCSVCHAPRATKVMIPAATKCPQNLKFTLEYRGFLMAEKFDHKRNAVYECVADNAQVLPGSAANNDGALFFHVISACTPGMPCPPFIRNRVLSCVVCTI